MVMIGDVDERADHAIRSDLDAVRSIDHGVPIDVGRRADRDPPLRRPLARCEQGDAAIERNAPGQFNVEMVAWNLDVRDPARRRPADNANTASLQPNRTHPTPDRLHGICESAQS